MVTVRYPPPGRYRKDKQENEKKRNEVAKFTGGGGKGGDLNAPQVRGRVSKAKGERGGRGWQARRSKSRHVRSVSARASDWLRKYFLFLQHYDLDHFGAAIPSGSGFISGAQSGTGGVRCTWCFCVSGDIIWSKFRNIN